VGQVLGPDGRLNDKALTTRFEPEDLNSLEQALQLKDRQGGTVTVLTLGPTRNVDVLRESLFRGVDTAIRLVAPAGVALDTAAQAELYAAAIRKLGAYQLVLVGVTVPEGENSLLGAEVAARLGHGETSYVDGLVAVDATGVVAKRAIEMGCEHVRLSFPAVLCVGVSLVKDDPRTPRSAKAMLKLKLKKAEIPEWTAASLGLNTRAAQVALSGYAAVPQRQIETKTVDPENAAALKAMLADVLGGAR
jgi:electron transfer flavoprotein beta subunit